METKKRLVEKEFLKNKFSKKQFISPFNLIHNDDKIGLTQHVFNSEAFPVRDDITEELADFEKQYMYIYINGYRYIYR